MYEEDLKRIVSLHPELIEEGLSIEEEEFPIRAMGATYRCDLRATDKDERTVLIELKLNAGRNVVYQIGKYKAFSDHASTGRFMVAALEYDLEAKQVLEAVGIETRLLDANQVEDLLRQEIDNPYLYERKSAITPQAQLIIRKGAEKKPGYTEEEREQVRSFLRALRVMVPDSSGMAGGFRFDRLDEDFPNDRYRLWLKSEQFPSDRVVVYVRPLRMNEIHLIYVADFSSQTRRATPRKKALEDFVLHNNHMISDIFGVPVVTTRQGQHRHGDRIEVSHQAWKGLARVYVRPVEEWNRPDFVEIVGQALLDFVEAVIPVVKQVYCKGSLVREV